MTCPLSRLSPTAGCVFPELARAALVRELHVYGKLVATSDHQEKRQTQHSGLGRQLMVRAESIAKHRGFTKIAVIAGVGTRRYYQDKLGYEYSGADGHFMVKNIGENAGSQDSTSKLMLSQWMVVICLAFLVTFYYRYISS